MSQEIKIGQRVKPNWGRNAGHWGIVRAISESHCLVNFGGNIDTGWGGGGQIAPDSYWVRPEDLEVDDTNK
jgi:hypothetical protein